MIEIKNKKDCAGCWACFNACPQKCISMNEDNEGFLYPVVDKTKCINCNICENVCPIKHTENFSIERKVFACYAKDENNLLEGSSGGFFGKLAEHVISEKGAVYGAAYEDAFRVVHVREEKDISKLKKSKYIQSEIRDVYKLVKKDLESNKLVLFTGTGCQVSGLKNFLKKDYNNLITQDLICHGVPSAKVWRKYLNDNNIPSSAKIDFRDKYYGWEHYHLKIVDNNNIIKYEEHNKNAFMQAFLQDFILRPSCYECKFRGDNRSSDITLADFWGVNNVCSKINNPNGTSLVIVNNKKGLGLFNKIKDHFAVEEVELEEAIKFNQAYISSPAKPQKRDKFFKYVNTKTLEAIMKKLNHKTLFIKMKNYTLAKTKSIIKYFKKKSHN